MKRVILLIIDSLGIGAMSDIEEERKQDMGSNTLKHILESEKNLKIPNLLKLGLINALGEEVGEYKTSKNATYGKAKLKHYGADSFYGHYEIAGAKVENPIIRPISFYIDHIKSRLKSLEYRVEEKIIENKMYLIVNEGIMICDNIEAEYGQVYTVIGSSFKTNYEKVKKVALEVRKIVEVSRVVAVICDIPMEELESSIEIREKDYIGINAPKCDVYNRGYKVEHLGYGISNKGHCVDKLTMKGIPVVLIGKVSDIIYGEVTKRIHGVETDTISKDIIGEIKNLSEGLIFANIQGTDLAGHLQNTYLYGKELEKVDMLLEEILSEITEEDLLIVMADHGNDPVIGHSKHTREEIPILLYNSKLNGMKFIGERNTLGDVGATITDIFNCEKTEEGESFSLLLKNF